MRNHKKTTDIIKVKKGSQVLATFEIVDYSEKAIAVFGEEHCFEGPLEGWSPDFSEKFGVNQKKYPKSTPTAKQKKSEKVNRIVSSLGGRFNSKLNQNGNTKKGWVFPMWKKQRVIKGLSGRETAIAFLKP